MCACESVWVQVPTEPQGIGFPGVKGSCNLPGMGTGNLTHVLGSSVRAAYALNSCLSIVLVC